jgi:hypothetical protein
VQSCVLLEALHYFFHNGDPGGREREREGGDANPGKPAGVKGIKVSLDSKNLIWENQPNTSPTALTRESLMSFQFENAAYS